MSMPQQREPGKFTQGSTLRHVLVMSATGSIGLMAIFLVDLLNLIYISWLGNESYTAAMGYAGTVLFFVTSVAIGVMIASSALVSRAIGARERDAANRLAASGLIFMILVTGVMVVALMSLTSPLLKALGATGDTFLHALRFLHFTLPAMVLLGLGMAATGLLRAVGDAKRSMWVTLGGGLATAFLDPLFIFVFQLGLDGAAIVTNISRVIFVMIGAYGVITVHKLFKLPTFAELKTDIKQLNAIAWPAIMTNLATPVANGFTTAVIARYGDAAVAAWAIIGRLGPVAFGPTFALSGAVGPILGQNLGARLFHRLQRVMTESLLLTTAYVFFVCALLYLGQNQIVHFFAASGETAELVKFYCTYGAISFLFLALLFVANTSFNNLGAPLISTALNWGRATVGTIPFVIYLGQVFGAEGVIIGSTIGGLIFGTVGILGSYALIRKIERKASL